MLSIIEEKFGLGLQSTRLIKKGEKVVNLEGVWVSEPSRYTIQLGPDMHLMPRNHQWALINHSCSPNLRVDPDRMAMFAAREIQPGEPLSFNYLTTEWDMAEPFDCHCQASNCIGHIAGLRHFKNLNDQSSLVWSNPTMSGDSTPTQLAASIF
jgi:hypothetical protein